MSTVFLTGFMGSGKTTVGRILARRTGKVFLDLDEEIVKRTGISIAGIFLRNGEDHFRRIESSLVKELASRAGVIAMGGGAVMDPGSRSLIRQSGTVIYLRASAATLVDRLRDEAGSRPLLHEVALDEFVPWKLGERSAFYEEAHLIIDTDELTPLEVADEIVKQMGEKSVD